MPDSLEPWTDLDDRLVDVARALAMDAVQRANSGHPGTAMSLAPVAHLLFSRFLRHDPADPGWPGRDRFVLSCGHSSLTLYVQLYLCGYPMTLDDLAALRTWGSQTPGHPEYRHTPGVEATTGPLGQGLAMAVGMAMAGRRERGLFDPDTPAGESPFDHTIWVIASDGDIEEGVTAEASSLAGHQRLGNLVVVYDDNHISIEGNTAVALSEDVLARYAAYGWHTQRVDDAEDAGALARALDAARAETDRPSIVAMRSVIAWPAPHARNTGKAHGSPLGEEEVRATKVILGLDPDATFAVPEDVRGHGLRARERGAALNARWAEADLRWRDAQPQRAAEYDRMVSRTLPDGWREHLPTFDPGSQIATRTASGQVLAALADVLPELWGGSADLAGSTDTTMPGVASFLPRESGAPDADPYGRTLHFGIREHAMGAVLNGIALHGPTRPYGATFLVFSDYMRPPVRLAAVMQLAVTYVWTHDSIGLGEDGPTHQPVEHLASLRAVPGLAVVRPADATETARAWVEALTRDDGPVALALTRQTVPTLDRDRLAPAGGLGRGAYVLAEADGGRPDVILIGTGSEVHTALAARDLLQADGIPARVVSMPCWEWFAEQDPAYREQVLPAGVGAKVAVEAGVRMGWREWVGASGEIVGLDHFGASAPYRLLYEQFGITPGGVVAAAHLALSRAGLVRGAPTGN